MTITIPRRKRHGRHADQRDETRYPDLPNSGASVTEAIAALPDAPVNGTHPYDQPLPQGMRERINGRRPHGSRHTQAWTPDFAEKGKRPRPYAPPAAVRRPYPWIPDTWHPRPSAWVQERMGTVTYPVPGAQPSEVAEFFRRIDLITGTKSSFGRPSRCTAWARGITAGEM
jgi:hypothetical protein